MKRLLKLMLLGLSGGAVMAGAPSPARVQLDNFLAAFNSGDRAAITAFGKEHAPPDFLRPAIVDQTLEMSRTSGGYDVLDVDETSPLALTSRVRARATNEVVLLSIVVGADSPERIRVITFHDSPTHPLVTTPGK